MLKIFRKVQTKEVDETKKVDAIEMLAKFTEDEAERKERAISFLERSATFISSASQYIWGIDEEQELEVGSVSLIKHEFILDSEKALLDQEGDVFWTAVKSIAESTEWIASEVQKIAKERQAIAEQIEITNTTVGQAQKVLKVRPVQAPKKEKQGESDLDQLDAVLA